MRKNNKINFFLESILENIESIEEYTKEIDHDKFIDTQLIQDAVTKKLENIGEAAKTIPEDFKNKNTQIPWLVIADTRNYLIHEYFGIDPEEVWNTIKYDLPELKKEIKKLLDQ